MVRACTPYPQQAGTKIPSSCNRVSGHLRSNVLFSLWSFLTREFKCFNLRSSGVQEGEEERTGSGLPTFDMGSKLSELKKTRKLGTDITLKVQDLIYYLKVHKNLEFCTVSM
jgi:hypothetical protein